MQTSFAQQIARSLLLLLQLQVVPASGHELATMDLPGSVDSVTAKSQDIPSPPSAASRCLERKPENPSEDSVSQGALLRVRPDESLSLSHLRSGSLVSGRLVRSLYCQDREAVPVGSQIQLVVETIEKDKPTRKWARELALRLWDPLSTQEPSYSIVFRSATLKLPDGRTTSMNVSFGGLFRFVKLQAKPSADSRVLNPAGSKTSPGETAESLQSTLPQAAAKQSALILRLERSLRLLGSPESAAHRGTEKLVACSESSAAHLSLLSPVSATRSREGERVQARLVEPIRFEGQLVPEGSLFEGRVTRRRAPRRLRRAGSLFVNFERMVTPSGQPIPINSSLISVESERKAHIRMDSEGMLRGRAPGLTAYAVDLGISYLSGKIIDDLIEEGVKAAVAGITSEKAASIGRYFGIGTGLCLFLMRRGRDVSLEQYSELEVTFKPQLERLSH